MKRTFVAALSLLAISTTAFAQTTQEEMDAVLTPAPRSLKEGATVIKWKPDFTYDTVRKGTNTLVCYDQSGWANEQPFSVQCTHIANLPRVAQNKKLEAIADNAARQAALAAAEKDGSRVKPEFGSMFITVSGADKDRTRTHMTIAVPGATTASIGLPEDNKQGGVWIMNAGTSSAHLMIPGS